MDSSRKNHVTAISKTFYKNVFLLTQVISPSFEFQQHFREDMFKRSNTTGFLHVSHYLAIIYDMKLFMKIVKWPIACKEDKVTFRTEMRNFLTILSQDNSDVNFPPIFTSYLVQAQGIKFLTIMWKLSQLALRAYIKRQSQNELLNVPHISLVDDLTTTYFNNIIMERSNIARKTHEEAKKILDTASNFLRNEIQVLNMYKSEIFDRKQNIWKLMSVVPTHPLIHKQLMDFEDLNIINKWKIDMLEKWEYLRTKNKKLKELKISCSYLCELILRIKSNSEMLDANQFPKLNINNHLLHTQSEVQHSIHNLYANGNSVMFSALLPLVNLAFTHILHHINASYSQNLLWYLSHVQNACKHMKTLQTRFIVLNMKINDMLVKEECAFHKIKSTLNFENNNTTITNMFLQSPKINIILNKHTDDNLFYEKLYSSPTKDKHEHLFRRHQRKCRLLNNLPYLHFNDSSWNNVQGWLSPRAHSSKRERFVSNAKSISPLHCRSLHYSKSRLKCSRENISHSLNLNEESKLNMRRRTISEGLTKESYGERVRNLFNSPILSGFLHVSSNNWKNTN